MRYIADLHIHSAFSRATSKASQVPGLAVWAAIKGIDVVGTGDFTHPGWLAHLRQWLVEEEPGFFRLKKDIRDQIEPGLIPETLSIDRIAERTRCIRFVLTAEISSIYKKDGQVRKIHNVLMAPGFTAVQRINTVLAGIGNLESDGRPILGLDAKTLLELTLEHGQGAFLVPAHVWTPWFSLFGSKSGFDAIEECFEDLSDEIFALETGLSSDPDMNRCVSALDRFTLISNSDCHSPAKLGREANIFDTGLDFPSMKAAMKDPVDDQGHQAFAATIEFYPEEGKYHCDGHRKCDVCLEPEQTRKINGICPRCGRPLTVGVLHRVMELADRTTPVYGKGAPGVHSLIPLPEILGELLGVGAATKKVARVYGRLINEFDSEFNLLLNADLDRISQAASPLLAEAVKRVRQGEVFRQPGYDGAFGVIRVFAPEEAQRLAGQLSLFGESGRRVKRKKSRVKKLDRQPSEALDKQQPVAVTAPNPAQEAAVRSQARHILVQAGPGTGKTFTLIERLRKRLGMNPDMVCTVITFTNKAAQEVRDRLPPNAENRVFADTLHGFCLRHLRSIDPELRVAGPELRGILLRRLNPDLNPGQRQHLADQISCFLRQQEVNEEDHDRIRLYLERLDRDHLIDLEAIVPVLVHRLERDDMFFDLVCRRTGDLYVDEFQDLSPMQYRLVKRLAHCCPVFAIGDPDQAIYGFRGADPQGFFRFLRELNPEAHTLAMNYRSDRDIVAAAGSVIGKNRKHKETVVAVSDYRGAMRLFEAVNPEGEARWIADRIEELVGGTSHRTIDRLDIGGARFGLSDIGILIRTNRQGNTLVRVLTERGFPVQMVDLKPFFCRQPVLPLYLWCLVGARQADCAHVLSLLTLEKGIGPATLDRCQEVLAEQPADPFAALTRDLDRIPASAREIVRQLDGLRTRFIRQVKDNGLVAALEALSPRYKLPHQDPEVDRFFHYISSLGGSLDDLARHLLAASHSVVYDHRAEAVTVMTLHAAKGTQFGAVFMAGVEDGLLPLAPPGQKGSELPEERVQEERRLFYVGMTRARHLLFLSWCRNRVREGETAPARVSPFVGHIDPALLHREQQKKKQRFKRQLTLFST